ncbi:hypothetical protein D3C77_641920 [compost metagenome]
MRLKLVCAMAVRLPIASDSTARIISIGCQSAARPCRPSTSRRSVMAKAASLGAPPRISVTAVGEPW